MANEEAEKYLESQIDILSKKVTAKHRAFKDDDQVRLIVDFANCLRKTRELSQKVQAKFGISITTRIKIYLDK